MARVKFKEAGLKKVGSRSQQTVEAGEIVVIPDGYLTRYGNQVEIVYEDSDETPPPSEEEKQEAISAAPKKKAAKKKD